MSLLNRIEETLGVNALGGLGATNSTSRGHIRETKNLR